MKRGIKLLILVLVLAALGGGYMLLSKSGAEEEPEGPVVYEDGSYELFSIPTGDIDCISWTCTECEGEFAFKNLGEIWTYIPQPELNLDNDYMNTLGGLFARFNVFREMEMPENPADYGLDKPFVTVKILKTDGHEVTICFGDVTSVAGRRYCTVGDGKVYTVSSSVASMFNYDLGSLVNLASGTDSE